MGRNSMLAFKIHLAEHDLRLGELFSDHWLIASSTVTMTIQMMILRPGLTFVIPKSQTRDHAVE
jgi:hypothetical protein